jgi:hypothetical protein
MSFFANNMISKGLQKGIVAAALMFGWLGGLANAAPISPESIRSAQVEAPIEKTQVVVHHRRPVAVHHHRRPVVVHHHHRRPVVVHHRPRHKHCWWSHGRRICRWR